MFHIFIEAAKSAEESNPAAGLVAGLVARLPGPRAIAQHAGAIDRAAFDEFAEFHGCSARAVRQDLRRTIGDDRQIAFPQSKRVPVHIDLCPTIAMAH